MDNLFIRTIPSAVQCWHWDKARCMSTYLAVMSTWWSWVTAYYQNNAQMWYKGLPFSHTHHSGPCWCHFGLLVWQSLAHSFSQVAYNAIISPAHVICGVLWPTDITWCLSGAVWFAACAALLSQPSRANPFKMALHPLNPSVYKFQNDR